MRSLLIVLGLLLSALLTPLASAVPYRESAWKYVVKSDLNSSGLESSSFVAPSSEIFSNWIAPQPPPQDTATPPALPATQPTALPPAGNSRTQPLVQNPAPSIAPTAPAGTAPQAVPTSVPTTTQTTLDAPPAQPSGLSAKALRLLVPQLPAPPSKATDEPLTSKAAAHADKAPSPRSPDKAPTEAIPPKITRLPPGPLTAAPVGIAASPNELRISGIGGSSAPWGIVLLLTVLTLIPSILICITPFARLLVVFHFLRQALGLQTTPSNQTLIGLTLILTFFIMEPVGKQIYEHSFVPLQAGQITAFEALARSEDPLRSFMVPFVREKDAALFLEIAKEPRPHDVRDLSMRVLVPAYIVSELKAGFQIGAVLFLPFLVVDIVVASITTSVGMMQLPPVVISTPLKLMLFLMVDGWHLLIGALVRSFA